MSKKLTLMQIRSFLEENFPFDLLSIEPSEEFIEELTCEIRVILNESNCQTFEEELYFLSSLVDRKYWKKRCKRQKMEQIVDWINGKKFMFSLK